MGDQELRTVFDSGIAETLGVPDEKAIEILLSNELVWSCRIIQPTFIQVDFKNPIGWGELFEFKRSLTGRGIRFEEKHSLKPLQS